MGERHTELGGILEEEIQTETDGGERWVERTRLLYEERDEFQKEKGGEFVERERERERK